MWTDVVDSVGELRKPTKPDERRSSRQSSRPLKLVQMLDLGLYNPNSGEFRDPRSSSSLSLADAIVSHLLDKNSVVINDPQSEEVLSLEESIRGGLVSGKTSLVHDTSTSENIPLTEALRRGILIPRPMSIATAINIGLYDESNGMFFDPTNGLYFALEEAVEGGLIDPHSLVIDPATGKAMAVAAALACGVLDARHGNVVNIHTGEVIPLKQMAVSSQAVLGSQPVGVSNQVPSASADAEEGSKPVVSPDVREVSDSRIVSTSGPSGDVLVTPGDDVGTKDIRANKEQLVKKTTGVPDATAEAASTSLDALQWNDMPSDRLADIPVDAQSSVDELTNSIMAPAGDVAGTSWQAESRTVQVVLEDDHSVSNTADTSVVHPADEVVVSPMSLKPVVDDESYRAPASDESSGAPVCDESSKASVGGDELAREIKRHVDIQPPDFGRSLPTSASTALTDQTAHGPLGIDNLGPPASTSLSAQHVFHEIGPVVTVTLEDAGRPESAADGVSGQVRLQHILSPSVAADTPVKADDVSPVGTARDTKLQQDAGAETPHSEADVASPENAESLAQQIQVRDSVHSRVGLDQMKQVEYRQAPVPDSMNQPQAPLGPHDVQQLQEVKHVVASDGMRSDDRKTLESDRDKVPEDDGRRDDRQKIKEEEHRDVKFEQQQLSNILQVEAQPFPDAEAKKDVAKKDEAYKDDALKDYSTEYDSKKDTENAAQSQGDVRQPSGTVPVEVRTVPSDDIKRDDSKSDVVYKEDSKKYVSDEDETQKDAVNAAKSRGDVQPVSNIIHAEVAPLPGRDVEKDVAKKDEAKRDGVHKDDQEKDDSSKKDIPKKDDEWKEMENVVEARDGQHVSDIAVTPLARDDSRKDKARKGDSDRDDTMKEAADDDVAAKDEVQKISSDVVDTQQLSSVLPVEVKSLPGDDKKYISKKDKSKSDTVPDDHSKKPVPKKDAVNIIESHDDIQQLSSIVHVSAKPVVCDDGKKDDKTEDRDGGMQDGLQKDRTGAIKRDDMEDGTKKDVTRKDDTWTDNGTRNDTQPLSNIMQIETKLLPGFDDSQRDEVFATDSKKDIKEDESQIPPLSAGGFHGDTQQLSEIMHVEMNDLPGDDSRKYEATEDTAKRDGTRKEGKEKDETRKDATNVSESQEYVQQLSSIIQAEVKPLPKEICQKDDAEQDISRRDDVVRMQEQVTETDGYTRVDDVKPAQEDGVSVEQKISDPDAVSWRERRVDTDVADDGQKVVALDMQLQQQEFILGSEVLTEEKVRRHEDELVTAEDGDKERQRQDLGTDHDAVATGTALVSDNDALR